MLAVDVTDIDGVQQWLKKLTPVSLPLWGNMTAQQMVEHMINEVQYTNGVKTPIDIGLPPDFKEQKKLWVYTDEPIPRNVVLGQLPDKYTYPNLETAKWQLLVEIENFHQHHNVNPGIEILHGGFGMMTYNEWIKWHNKHFTHHFKQFGLIE
ncbi:hypothetical protein FPZ42_00060 [Mucilaginibacter achroorhodeus]|uniref:DUF1569 domain-containing protein n=1 Tax=Mucilaginibacter achroorhodeus TaxID=2599294 RepID=A0A563U8J3_9SPHI|nr:hypothetical protein [Mucilaginibacter achroorhodeus]TWR27644.1 hypothetical protein FPZ42_00060 [Mucilaginibacter achroorhodeus]